MAEASRECKQGDLAAAAPTIPKSEVLVLTTLPEAYQAVLRFLHLPQEIVHPSGTLYAQGTFPGKQGLWHVAVAQIGTGGILAAVEVEKAISFFPAHIALFVGIAGGRKEVQPGDVVVATKIYAYESGKAGSVFEPRPQLWHPSYALEQRARQEALEGTWLTRLDERPDPAPRVHLGPLAAGATVFASTQGTTAGLLTSVYGDALAVEMEGHGFLQAIHHHTAVHGLVIRGIANRIDDKASADAAGWPTVAAAHAAAFAFQILALFTLPASNDPSTRAPLWNLPYARHPFFTGREAELELLHQHLQTMQAAAVSQPRAISGLGGIGKTQLAIEYAYRYRQEYQAVLWARADTTETLHASYAEIAGLLSVPQHDAQEQALVVQAVKQWLRTHDGWLLILDNADELDLVHPFLPTECPGHLLLTTRAQWMGALAQPLEIETLEPAAGALLCLRRARLVAPDAFLDAASPEDQAQAFRLVKALGGLPLALDQAGAYIEETGCSLADYVHLYHTEQTRLLARRGGRAAPHPEPVATTWSLAFVQVAAANPLAAEVLRLCAFLAPDAIPEALLVEALNTPLPPLGAPKKRRRWGRWFSPRAPASSQDPEPLFPARSEGALHEAVAILRAYSLVQRKTADQALAVHRLVQAVLRESMSETERQAWVKRLVRGVRAALPSITFANWSTCEQYVAHAQECVQRTSGSLGEEEAAVWHWLGAYLLERHRTEEAGRYVQQALMLREQHLGREHLETASSLDRVARWWELQGKYAAAEPLYVRGLAIREQELGDRHPSTAQSLNNLAALYQQQGKYASAEPLYVRALAICEQELGARHPDTASSLNNLAALYERQGKYASAEPLLVRALAICEQELGARHPSTASSLNNLALLYGRQGKYAEAEPLLVRALAICEQELGARHPDTALSLNNLAALYQQQGKDAEAEPLYVRALAIREQELGARHPSTASSLNNLALLYRYQGMYSKAEPLYKQALDIDEACLGATHPTTQTIRANYVALLKQMKDSASSEKE